MSGTSADGVDAVLADFQGRPAQPRWRIIRHRHCPYPDALRRKVVSAGQGEPLSAEAWLNLAEAITETQAKAVLSCDPNGESQLIGCHGQTLWHRPPQADQRGASWQVLQAPLLSQLTGRPVIHDFRAADLALGGQGAPLVPRADAALFGGTEGWRALLNLGGIANLTLIPPCCGPERQADVLGWDCGPANSLIDLAVSHFTDGKQTFDRDGAMAAAGSISEECITHWLKEPYFHRDPPKSTGRELFGLEDLNRRLQELNPGHSNAEDALATLTGFSAEVVGNELNRLMLRSGIRPLELVVAGGGRHNPTLMRELRKRCRGVRLVTSDTMDVPAETREALVFALLAWWHVRRYPANSPHITGAERETVLGVMVNPA